jgi:hypothetical protein
MVAARFNIDGSDQVRDKAGDKFWAGGTPMAQSSSCSLRRSASPPPLLAFAAHRYRISGLGAGPRR